MSTDTAFEEVEKTAFEFAKAMGAETGANLSQNAMKLAEQWHAESELRQSLYRAERATWEKIDRGIDYSSHDFVVNAPYWVITEENNKIVQASFLRFSEGGGLPQPLFYEGDNDFVLFAVSHYIKKAEGDQILSKTWPKRPADVHKKRVRPPQIPVIKSFW